MISIVRCLVYIVLATSLGAIGCRAQVVAEPAIVDMGRHQTGDIVNATVKLKNNGNVAVGVLEAVADCSCTIVQLDKRVLASGESVSLEISIDTHNYQGELRRTVVVETSTGTISIPLKVTVNAYEHWTFEPSVVVMRPTQSDQETAATVQLHYSGAGTAKIGKIESTSEWVDIKTSTRDGKTFSLALMVRAGAAAALKPIKLFVGTSDPDAPRLTLDVFVQKPLLASRDDERLSNVAVRAVPSSINFGTVNVGERASRELALEGWARWSLPRMQMNHGEVQPLYSPGDNRHYTILWTPMRPGVFTSVLRIFDGDSLKLEVPVTLRARSAGDESPAQD